MNNIIIYYIMRLNALWSFTRLRARWANCPRLRRRSKFKIMTPRPTWLENYKIKKLLRNITAMQQQRWCVDGGDAGRVDWPRGQLDNKNETDDCRYSNNINIMMASMFGFFQPRSCTPATKSRHTSQNGIRK